MYVVGVSLKTLSRSLMVFISLFAPILLHLILQVNELRLRDDLYFRNFNKGEVVTEII